MAEESKTEHEDADHAESMEEKYQLEFKEMHVSDEIFDESVKLSEKYFLQKRNDSQSE